MSQPQVETCQIRLKYVYKGFLRHASLVIANKQVFRWVAEVLTGARNDEITQTEEFELRLDESVRKTDPLAEFESRAIITTEARLIRQQLLQQLQADGWEYVTSDPSDRITTLKRMKAQVASSDNLAFSETLRQLASLRDAGIITPEEFETKKAEILKKI